MEIQINEPTVLVFFEPKLNICIGGQFLQFYKKNDNAKVSD